jgi:amidase
MQVVDKSVYTFSKDNPPVCKARPGEILLFRSMDCFGGQLTSEDQQMGALDLTKVNPAAGPVFVEGAEPGDVLVVDVLDITVADVGVSRTAGKSGPLRDICQPRNRIMPIVDGFVQFNDIRWPINPMVGVMGTTPAGEPIATGYAGNHGGNMDSKKITKGTKVYFPVWVPGALLQMGDIHATMGDGEICSTGVEIAGEILVRISLIKQFALNWPFTETKDTWYVNATGKDYDEALILGCKELCRLMEPVYGWDATDIFIYLSAQGDVEINQACRPMRDEMVNIRVGIPKTTGKGPLIG